MHAVIAEIPAYFLMWVLAAVLCVALGANWASRAGFPVIRSGSALVVCSAIILVGSKALYLTEAKLFPFDDYVPHIYVEDFTAFAFREVSSSSASSDPSL